MLIKQKNVLKPPINKIRNHLVASPIIKNVTSVLLHIIILSIHKVPGKRMYVQTNIEHH